MAMHRRRFFLTLWGALGALLVFGVSLCTIPRAWCGREARAWYGDDRRLQEKLARGMEDWITSTITLESYKTGNSTYNGEWLMGTCLMAGLGFGQTALTHPELKERHLRMVRLCIEKILSHEARGYDRDAWHEDPLGNIRSPRHHLAYLGYMNVLLSYARCLERNGPYARLNDLVSEKLDRAYRSEPSMLLYTYPDQKYLPDNCAAMASLALHERAVGAGRQDLIRRWCEKCRTDYCDPRTGLLYQTDRPPGRGSGTAMGIYFLSFVDRDLSAQLYWALREHLAESPLGFGTVREYARGYPQGPGDIDSGPVILGWGFSATGFSIAGSRIHGDLDLFTRLCRTVYLAGAPADDEGKRIYAMGGPLGNAILFAMLTARHGEPMEEGAGK